MHHYQFNNQQPLFDQIYGGCCQYMNVTNCIREKYNLFVTRSGNNQDRLTCKSCKYQAGVTP